LKIRQISHCETLEVSVAFAVAEQAFEELRRNLEAKIPCR